MAAWQAWAITAPKGQPCLVKFSCTFPNFRCIFKKNVSKLVSRFAIRGKLKPSLHGEIQAVAACRPCKLSLSESVIGIQFECPAGQADPATQVVILIFLACMLLHDIMTL